MDQYEERLLMQVKKRHRQCVFCKHDMKIDDIDYQFEGCQDEYWYCPNCSASLFIKVRYNKVVKKEFEKGEQDVSQKKEIDKGTD